jgi:hypothetical protein
MTGAIAESSVDKEVSYPMGSKVKKDKVVPVLN